MKICKADASQLEDRSNGTWWWWWMGGGGVDEFPAVNSSYFANKMYYGEQQNVIW